MNASGGLDAATLTVAAIAAEHAERVDRDSCVPEQAIAALRRESLLSLLVPVAAGGPGRSLSQVAALCHALGQSCGSTGMIYAMHQIQVACIVAHGQHSDWHRSLLRRLCAEQLLLGSVTSEVGTGGNILNSVCAIQVAGDTAQVEKDATTVSYGAHADALLVTCRRHVESAPNDQVMVIGLRDDYVLERTGTWDALGMRGTGSDAFRVRFSGRAEQILPVPFAEIAGQTMLPVSHMLWASVWLGIATDAVNRARAYLRQQVRGRSSVSAMTHRLARAVGLLQLMQSRLSQSLRDYETVFAGPPRSLPLGFTADMNNLKANISEMCLEAVHHAFMVCGISAYRNGTAYSLGRHLRDLTSAPVMINNDRMLESAGNLLLMQKPALGVF